MPTRVRSRRVLRALACAIAAGVLAMPPAGGTSLDRLERARREVASLAARIDAQAQALASAREALATLDAQVHEASERMARYQGIREQVRDRLALAQARYEAAQEVLSASVARAFMDAGPGSADLGALGAILGSASLDEASDRAVYAAVAGEGAIAMADGVEALRDDLAARSDALDALVSAEATSVDELERLRDGLEAAVADEAVAAAALDAARDEAIAVVERLERDLFGANGLDLSPLGDALHGANHVSYGTWAGLFLDMFGAPACRSNLVVVVAWQAAEGTQAAWNPLATTHRMPGSWSFNSVGVQNFVSLEQGLLGTKETIENGWDVYRYGAIVRSLRGCADATTTALAINASSWCPGCVDGRYVLNVVPRVEANLEAYLRL